MVFVSLRCRWTSPFRAWKRSLSPQCLFPAVRNERQGWFGPAAAQAVPALVEALKVEHLRREPIKALGKIRPQARAAIPALVALRDEVLVGIHAKESAVQNQGQLTDSGYARGLPLVALLRPGGRRVGRLLSREEWTYRCGYE